MAVVAFREYNLNPIPVRPDLVLPFLVTRQLGLAHPQLRLRAYEFYEARGREDGYELEDWLRAKEEIREKEFRTATA